MEIEEGKVSKGGINTPPTTPPPEPPKGQGGSEITQDKLGLTIGPRSVRKLAIKLLDDENGIDIEAYRILSGLLVETGNEDILEQADVTEDRVYVGEDWAEEELNKIEKDNEAE